MMRVLKALGATALMALVVMALAVPAAAAPIISISPASQTVGFDDTFSVDILVSGLDGTAAGAVGGFSALLSFDSSLIAGVSYVVDPDAKMGVALDPGTDDLSGGFGGGGASPLDLFFISDASLGGAALAGLQGTGFKLATVTFKALFKEGLSALALSVVAPGGTFLSDPTGADLPASAKGGSVCVSRTGAPCTVPEPGLLALVATGLVTAVAARRRQLTKG